MHGHRVELRAAEVITPVQCLRWHLVRVRGRVRARARVKVRVGIKGRVGVWGGGWGLLCRAVVYLLCVYLGTTGGTRV